MGSRQSCVQQIYAQLNQHQQAAVNHVVGHVGDDKNRGIERALLIQGPPGTGKTHTIMVRPMQALLIDIQILYSSTLRVRCMFLIACVLRMYACRPLFTKRLTTTTTNAGQARTSRLHRVCVVVVRLAFITHHQCPPTDHQLSTVRCLQVCRLPSFPVCPGIRIMVTLC